MDTVMPNPSRKRRHSKACTRCRKRKIRCDFQYPICGACLSSGATCLGFDSLNKTDKPRSTISHLENEVARLEIELGRMKSHTKSISDTVNVAVERLTTSLARAILEPSGRSRKQETLLPLTSRFFLSGSPVPYLSSQIRVDTEFVQIQADDDPPSAIAISLIPRHLIEIMLKNYCEMYRPRYPAIEESDLYEACDRVYSNAKPSDFDCFCTYITLAISTNTLVHHDEKRARIASSRFWATAVVHLDKIGLSNSWERLQALQLLAHYGFLNPRDVDCSKCAAAATRLCFELGLHHELPTSEQIRLDATALNTRRRLFWNSYSIDSAVHTVRCRPFVMPASAFTAKFPTSDSKSSPGIHVFLLRQIESEITMALYYPSLGLEDSVSKNSFGQWYTRMHERLSDWYQATRQSVNLTQKIEFHELFFHVQMLRLNRPSPHCPNPTKEMSQKALKASITLIKEFSAINRLGKLFNVWHAAYHIIESGICLLASVLTGMTSVAEDVTHLGGEDVAILKRYVQAFSLLISQISRRWSNIARHAFALEAISSSVLDKLEQWSSGEVFESSAAHELKQKLNQASFFSPFSLEALSPSDGYVMPQLNNYANIQELSRPNQITGHYAQLAATTGLIIESHPAFNSSNFQVPLIEAESFNSGLVSSEPTLEYGLDMFPEPYGMRVEDALQWDFAGMDSEEIFAALLETGEIPLADDFVRVG